MTIARELLENELYKKKKKYVRYEKQYSRYMKEMLRTISPNIK